MRYLFVDCRYDLDDPAHARLAYEQGHIPGAVFMDLQEDLSGSDERAGGRHPLPTAEEFAERASHAGIGPGVMVVAYDDGMTGGAARLWWLLRHFGHDDVGVLAGGLGAWQGPLAYGTDEAEPARFEARPRTDDRLDAEDIERRLGDPSLLVVDARAPDRFRGENETRDPVGGHIPGARNLPFQQVGDGIPQDVLEAPELVVYCGSGVTACVDVLALHRAGRTDARLYPGSWSDWSRRGLPVET